MCADSAASRCRTISSVEDVVELLLLESEDADSGDESLDTRDGENWVSVHILFLSSYRVLHKMRLYHTGRLVENDDPPEQTLMALGLR